MLYVVCGIRRTGTTVLVKMLHAAGLGFAHEFLNGVYALPATPNELLVHIFMMQPTADYTGLKVTWGDLDRLGVHWSCTPDAALMQILQAVNAETVRYIYPTRRDHEAQARSSVRAQMTGQWHVYPGRVVANAPDLPLYRVEKEMVWIRDAEQRWETFFQQHGIIPLRLVYEDWQDDPVGAWVIWARCIGADVRREDAPSIPLQKIAREP